MLKNRDSHLLRPPPVLTSDEIFLTSGSIYSEPYQMHHLKNTLLSLWEKYRRIFVPAIIKGLNAMRQLSRHVYATRWLSRTGKTHPPTTIPFQ